MLKRTLQAAQTYEDWEKYAYGLDSLLGNDLWRQNPQSSKYDYRLLSTRLKQLVEAKETENIPELLSRLRSGLLRNLGSMGNSALYNRSYSGTKLLIEDYVSEVIHCLEFLATQSPRSGSGSSGSGSGSGGSSSRGGIVNNSNTTNREDPGFMTHQQKLDFFHDTRQSFGRSALVLHGGSLFGLCHIGVVKGLYMQGLLPRIISGATVGALVGALVCSFTDDELLDVLDNLASMLPQTFNNAQSDIKFYSIFERVVSSAYPPELLVLANYVKGHLGDLTFEEAYVKTDRVLNITVKSSNPSMPTLLNYLTTPNVTMWSAVVASIGTGVLQEHVELMVVDHNGVIRPYKTSSYSRESKGKGPSPNTTTTATITTTATATAIPSYTFTPSNRALYDDRNSPYTKMAELFNVNNFTVSLARPYLAPLFSGEQMYRGQGGWLPRLSKLIKLELQHRLRQLAKLHLLPDLAIRILVDERIPTGFDVTVVPELESLVRDLGKLLDTDDIRSKVEYFIKVGEQSVWPQLAIIWARCAVEFVLDDVYNTMRKNGRGL